MQYIITSDEIIFTFGGMPYVIGNRDSIYESVVKAVMSNDDEAVEDLVVPSDIVTIH